MAEKKWKKALIYLILLLLFVVISGFFYLRMNTYQPETAAVTAAKSAENEKGVLFFEGGKDNPAVIFYQGALIENESYAVWANEVAKAGYSVYLLKQPLNLAVFGQNDAGRLIEREKISKYVIGGHSLGAVMGSRFAHEHLTDERLKGVIFLAGYPDKKGSLNDFRGAVLSITGTNDSVLNQENFFEAKDYLPATTVFEEIQGGNHAGFGSYGQQKGDSKPEINGDEQQEIISDLLIQWLSHLDTE